MSTFILCMFLLITGKVVHLQTSNGRNNIGSCPRLTRDDFGSSDALSADGIVAQILQNENTVQVRIVGVNIVCEAAGLEKDTISSISVIITYEYADASTGSAPINRTEQFQLDCTLDVSNKGSFSPYRVLPAGNIRTQNRTLGTPFNERCGQCADPVIFTTVDADTHCFLCSMECIGQRRCLGIDPNQCCNWYLNDECVVNCPAPLVGDEVTFDCGCGALNVNNAILIDFSDRFSVGSIATQMCDSESGYILKEGDVASNTRTCTMNGTWSGSEIACEMTPAVSPALLDGATTLYASPLVLVMAGILPCGHF